LLGAGSALRVDDGRVRQRLRRYTVSARGRTGNPAAAIRAGSDPAFVSIGKLLRWLTVFAER